MVRMLSRLVCGFHAQGRLAELLDQRRPHRVQACQNVETHLIHRILEDRERFSLTLVIPAL